MIFKSINVDVNEDNLVEYDFEYELSGASLLGRDISKEVNQKTKAALLEILNRETDENGQFRLAIKIAGIRSTAEDDFEKKLSLLNALKQGIVEGKP